MSSAGVTVVLVRAPPSREPPSRRAHVALYAGIRPAEVTRLLARALRLPAVCGFLVAAGGARRVVPLSLACLAPELLATVRVDSHSTFCIEDSAKKSSWIGFCVFVQNVQTGNGSVTALVTLADAAKTGKAADGGDKKKQEKPKETEVDRAEARERIGRFIAALSAEKELSAFEAAVLAELCEQQPVDVLSAMRSGKSVAQKKQFLLSLAHFGRGDAFSSARKDASTPTQNGFASPSRAQSQQGTAADAQVELVYQKIVAIARNVFSPQVQAEILDAAASYREKRATARGPGLPSGAAETGVSHKMELLGIFEKLLSKHALPEEQVAYLVGLVLTENRLLLSALQSYRIDFSLPDLEKAVKQIAALGPAATAPSSSSASAPATKSATSKSPKKRNSPRKKQFSTSRAPQALQGLVPRPINILHSLHQKQMITSLEYDILGALVKQQDSQVLAAVDEFQRSRDLTTLRDALVYIVEEITMELGDEEKAHFVRSMSVDHTTDVSVVNWQSHLIRYVHHWAERKVLDAEYAVVLEKLISENHNLLQSAYEVFASDEDETELLDTLQRIAKLQLQAEEGAALQLFSQVVNAHCDVLRENEKALVKQLFVRRNELVRAAWEVFELEKNVHDLGDTLLRIARFTSRNDSKLRLVEVVGEMMRRKLIRSHEADGLIRLYEQKNEALLAANEAFESDGDIKELVETLLLVVKHADFGEPPVCSPRHNKRGAARSTDLSLDQFDADSEEYTAAQLIEKLARKGRLSEWQRELLLTLLGQSDDRLLAAIDVYKDDQDLDEYVDTIWRLCDLLVWEENHRSIVRDWILPLEKQGRVEPGVLQTLVEARDDRILAAFIVYLGDNDDDEFADTLERISRIASPKLGGSGATDALTESNEIEMVDREVDPEEADGVLAWLSESGLISGEEWAEVQTLYSAYHAQVLAAFDVYHATKDSEDLADTLQRILARCAALKSDSSSSGALSPSTSKTARMEKQLLHFASELGLAPDELAALKRSIARQDEILEAAVEVYEMEKDEVRALCCASLMYVCVCVANMVGVVHLVTYRRT